MVTNPLVDAADLAAHFSVSIGTVNRWVREGLVPCVRPTRKTVRFRVLDVESALLYRGESHHRLDRHDPTCAPSAKEVGNE